MRYFALYFCLFAFTSKAYSSKLSEHGKTANPQDVLTYARTLPACTMSLDCLIAELLEDFHLNPDVTEVELNDALSIQYEKIPYHMFLSSLLSILKTSEKFRPFILEKLVEEVNWRLQSHPMDEDTIRLLTFLPRYLTSLRDIFLIRQIERAVVALSDRPDQENVFYESFFQSLLWAYTEDKLIFIQLFKNRSEVIYQFLYPHGLWYDVRRLNGEIRVNMHLDFNDYLSAINMVLTQGKPLHVSGTLNYLEQLLLLVDQPWGQKRNIGNLLTSIKLRRILLNGLDMVDEQNQQRIKDLLAKITEIFVNRQRSVDKIEQGPECASQVSRLVFRKF